MVTDNLKEAVAPGYIHNKNSKKQIYVIIYVNGLAYGFFNHFRGKYVQ